MLTNPAFFIQFTLLFHPKKAEQLAHLEQFFTPKKLKITQKRGYYITF